MRVNTSSSSSPTSWAGHKENGKKAFEQADYETALASYAASLDPGLHCPAAEKQIILSNMVACRLKIGGAAQAEAAVETAKQCVALNDQWAKGHVRLASAYIELGGHSNDACNALQRAIQLDPGNPAARDMLVRELRRDHHHASSNSSSRATTSGNNPQSTPSAPPHDQDNQNYSSSPPAADPANNIDDDDAPPPPHFEDIPNIDDSVTLQGRVQFFYSRCKSWYYAQSNDVKTVLKVFCALVLLYVAFGGRFGLDSVLSGQKKPRGNYGAGNVYDQYYGRRGGESSSSSDKTRTSSSSSYPYDHSDDHRERGAREYDNDKYRYDNDDRQSSSRQYDDHRSSGNNRRGYDDYQGSHHHRSNRYDDDRYYGGRQQRRPNSSSMLDGGLPTMMIIAGVAYIMHRNGINPLNALFLANMGRRARHRGRGMYGGGMGMGMGGMGGMRYGMGRPRPRW